jgi:hypothetical protein
MKNLALLAALFIVVVNSATASADEISESRARVIRFDASPSNGITPHFSVYITGEAAKLIYDKLDQTVEARDGVSMKKGKSIFCGIENGEYNCSVGLSMKGETLLP